MRTRRLVVLLVLVVLVAVAALASIAVGTRSIGLGEVWRALFDSDLTSEEAVIVRQLRVPRTVLGLLVGLALGISGALMQGHTRNPLGDPGLLGVTAGASLAVVVAIALLGIASAVRLRLVRLRSAPWPARSSSTRSARPAAAAATPVTLALAGAALSALLYALVRAVLVSDQQTLDSLPVLGGRLAGRPRAPTSPGRWRPFIAARAWCSRWPTPRRSTCSASARTSPAGWASGSGSARVVGLAAITLLVRRRHGRLRADRLRRPGRAARRPRRHRPRPPLADPLLRRWPAPPCC